MRRENNIQMSSVWVPRHQIEWCEDVRNLGMARSFCTKDATWLQR